MTLGYRRCYQRVWTCTYLELEFRQYSFRHIRRVLQVLVGKAPPTILASDQYALFSQAFSG